MEAKYEFLKNMTVFPRLNFYSNYLKDPQNIDISWDVQLNMAINQWFSCNIITNMIYDNDTKILQKDGTKGPRLQFKKLWPSVFRLLSKIPEQPVCPGIIFRQHGSQGSNISQGISAPTSVYNL